MSITPVDKPPDGDEEPDSTYSRRSSLLREYVGRFFAWLSERASTASQSSTRRDTARSTGTDDSEGGVEVEAEPVKSTDCPAFKNFPGREKPLTYPARNSAGINTPDVVCVETEDGLRLSVPENPDAELTSDVWMDVEP